MPAAKPMMDACPKHSICSHPSQHRLQPARRAAGPRVVGRCLSGNKAVSDGRASAFDACNLATTFLYPVEQVLCVKRLRCKLLPAACTCANSSLRAAPSCNL